jgi:hypothetical protein
MNRYFLSLITFFALPLLSDKNFDEIKVSSGDIWVLETRSYKMSPMNSEVLYFMPNDAYSTYQARKFGNWDIFSITDSRNLERLNTGDTIEIVESKYREKVYEVKLLNGFNKNKNFFIITDDLIDNFSIKEQSNE